MRDDFFADSFLSDWKFEHHWAKHDKASNRYSYKTINGFSPTIEEKASLMEERGVQKQIWADTQQEEN